MFGKINGTTVASLYTHVNVFVNLIFFYLSMLYSEVLKFIWRSNVRGFDRIVVIILQTFQNVPYIGITVCTGQRTTILIFPANSQVTRVIRFNYGGFRTRSVANCIMQRTFGGKNVGYYTTYFTSNLEIVLFCTCMCNI
jgi:hypothetical protein